MKHSNWSYLAGVIDGEGHIGITKGCRYWTNKSGETVKYPAYCLQISIANNSEELMKYLIRNFGGVYYTHTRTNPNANDGYNWMPKGLKNREQLLLAVLPYLVIKTEQAKVALEFIRMEGRNDPPAREALYQRFLKLNHRGKSPTTNTPDSSPEEKIESELDGDVESAPVVMQGVVNSNLNELTL